MHWIEAAHVSPIKTATRLTHDARVMQRMSDGVGYIQTISSWLEGRIDMQPVQAYEVEGFSDWKPAQ